MGWSLIGSVNIKYTIINYQRINDLNFETEKNNWTGIEVFLSWILRLAQETIPNRHLQQNSFVLPFPCYQQNNAYSRHRLNCVINCVGRQKVQKSWDWKFSGGYEVENWRLKVRGWTLLVNIINLVLTALALAFPVLSL